MSAFGRAMLDQLAHPERNVTFCISANGQFINCPCDVFTVANDEEQQIINNILRENRPARVLDIGSGIGRHSHFVCETAEELLLNVAITIVESDRELREHTLQSIPNAVGFERFEGIPPESRFDLIFLLGNGLGIFGSEQETREGLRRVSSMLSAGGNALIECGNPFGGNFREVHHRIEYGGMVDGPFPWGYATSEWLNGELPEAGLGLVLQRNVNQRFGPNRLHQVRRI
jgi:SAM-dependent methyltransferase